MTDSRKDARARLAKLIRDNCNPHLINDAFSAPRTSDIGEREKIVYVGTMGEGDPRIAQDVVFKAYLLSINLIARYPADNAGWAQSQVDETLDDMRAEVDRIIEKFFIIEDGWQSLTFEGASVVLDINIEEKQIKYRTERIPIRVIS